MKQTQDSFPEWYWSHGLHDANILSATNTASNWNPDDNCLILKIDCDGAMFETDIAEIRFYHYQIKTSEFDIRLLNGGWWLSDELLKKGNRYLLDLKFDTAKCKTKHLQIAFQRAEVIRKKMCRNSLHIFFLYLRQETKQSGRAIFSFPVGCCNPER